MGMHASEFGYEDSLEYFLSNSDEDLVDSAEIVRFLETNLVQETFNSTLQWLDVGCGPGTKPLKVLRSFLLSTARLGISMTMVEPSKHWTIKVRDNFAKSGMSDYLARVYQTTWEDFSTSDKIAGKFNFISFLHSVYGISQDPNGILTETPKLEHLLADGGWCCFAVESPNSDLYTIKLALASELGFAIVDYRTVEHTLSSNSWTYLRSADLDQRFFVDYEHSRSQNSLLDRRVTSFVVNSAPREVATRLTKRELERVNDVITASLRSDGDRLYLNVPDRLYWTQCKQGRAER